MAVVKADAYGHGLKEIAGLLMQSGADSFGVANLAEAQTIRRVGRGWPILMLGACLPGEEDLAVRENIALTLSSIEEARRFSTAAKKMRRPLDVHLKVDTGMGRLGVAPGAALDLVRELQSLELLRLQGVYTHYSSAEDDQPFSSAQSQLFHEVVETIRAGGFRIPLLHASNSAGLLYQPETILDLVRPGLLVYGIAPPGRRRDDFSGLQGQLKPALSFKCRVALVKEIRRGTSLSYGHTFKAPRRMRVATLTAGYGDGFLRAGSNRAQILVGGARCPVLGRVTMDQTIVDVSHLPEVAAGDEAVLIGRQAEEVITATELAGWCGTIPWEILTAITYRVPRIYRGGHAS
jgi:alanine racemase